MHARARVRTPHAPYPSPAALANLRYFVNVAAESFKVQHTVHYSTSVSLCLYLWNRGQLGIGFERPARQPDGII